MAVSLRKQTYGSSAGPAVNGQEKTKPTPSFIHFKEMGVKKKKNNKSMNKVCSHIQCTFITFFMKINFSVQLEFQMQSGQFFQGIVTEPRTSHLLCIHFIPELYPRAMNEHFCFKESKNSSSVLGVWTMPL